MKRRYIIVIMLLIVILLITAIYINNYKTNQELIINNNSYSRITINMIENEQYNIIEEKITLNDNNYIYSKNILYSNEQISLTKEGILLIEESNIILDDIILILTENKLCYDSNCTNPFYKSNSKTRINYIEQINPNDYFISLKKVEKNKEPITIISIIDNNTDSNLLKNNYLNILNEYDTSIYYINLNKLSNKKQKNIKDSYNIETIPTTLVFKEGKEINRLYGTLNNYDLHELLTNLGIKSR